MLGRQRCSPAAASALSGDRSALLALPQRISGKQLMHDRKIETARREARSLVLPDPRPLPCRRAPASLPLTCTCNQKETLSMQALRGTKLGDFTGTRAHTEPISTASGQNVSDKYQTLQTSFRRSCRETRNGAALGRGGITRRPNKAGHKVVRQTRARTQPITPRYFLAGNFEPEHAHWLAAKLLPWTRADPGGV